MKKKIIQPISLVLVFLISVLLFSLTTNKSSEDMTTKMQAAELPVVHFLYNGVALNELHGYATPMNVVKVRDAITPMGADRLLFLQINTYGMEIDGISYAIRSIDGERLVADGEITDATQAGNRISANLTVQSLIEKNTEYMFILTLQAGEREIYYYSRIIQSEDYAVDECLAFAWEFHDYTFRDDAAEFIPTYMDAATGDATTLNYVDLSCTLKQITWADFEGEVLTKPVASFKEINSSYNAITLDYVMTVTDENGETEFYNVEEYYRLRQTPTRIYVLNFERRMNQIFQGENSFVTDKTNIQLGIRSPEVEYATSEAGDIIAFVQEGELWCYNQTANEMAQVFSFRSAEGMDTRENWNQHDIKIARIDEAGSVDFLVYGYMNRGEHEGSVGIGVYHYDGLSYTVEEEAFIPVDLSYEVLKAEMGQLMYENEQGMLYFVFDGCVYQLTLDTLELEQVITGLSNDRYAVSSSGRYIAYVDAEEMYNSPAICLMDFKKGTSYTISESADDYLLPLEFIGEDLIYGIARADEVQTDVLGTMEFPMYQIKIMDTSEESHEVIKTYGKDGAYIKSVSVSGYIIQVNLMELSDGQYIDAGSDTIMNREADKNEKVLVTTTVTKVEQTQVQLALKKAIDTKKLRHIYAQNICIEEERNVVLSNEVDEECFYVYVKGDVVLATEHISKAIDKANVSCGVVVDSGQRYIWMRSPKSSQSTLTNLRPNDLDSQKDSVVQCLSVMLEREDRGIGVGNLVARGKTPMEIMQEQLSDAVVLDLTGCSVEEVLYYVGNGSPVLALTGTDSAVLIVGYTSGTISCYDPQAGAVNSISREEAQNLFAQAGNVFFSYIK